MPSPFRFFRLVVLLCFLFSCVAHSQGLADLHITNGSSIALHLGSPDEKIISPTFPDSIPSLFAIATNLRADTVFVISRSLKINHFVVLEIPVANPQDYLAYPIYDEFGDPYPHGPCVSLTQDWSTGELLFNNISSSHGASSNLSSSQVIKIKRGNTNKYVITSRVDYDYLPFMDLTYSPWYGAVGLDAVDNPRFNGRPFIQVESALVLTQPTGNPDIFGGGLVSYPYGEISVCDSRSINPDVVIYSTFNAATGMLVVHDSIFNPLAVNGEINFFDAASSWPDSLYVSMSFEDQELAPCQRSRIRLQVVDARRSRVAGDSIQFDAMLPEGLMVTEVFSSRGTLLAWQQVGQTISLRVPWTEHPIEDFYIEYKLESTALAGNYNVQADVFLANGSSRYTRSDEPLLAGERNPSPFRILPVDSSNFTTVEYHDLCIDEEISIELPDSWISFPAAWDDGNTSIPLRIIDESGLYTASISTECGEVNYTVEVRQSEGEVEIKFPDVSCSIADLEVNSSFAYLVTDWQLEISGEIIEDGQQLPLNFTSAPFRNGDTIRFIAIDELGCQYESSVEARISTCFGFPTAFSPDGNGINDFFGPLSDSEITGTLLVFDRWGNQVFEGDCSTVDESSHWDGKFRGKPLNPGVYVFTFETNGSQGLNERFIKGHITLVR